MKTGALYLVATPIGNLEDLTFRAVRILKEVDVIACEDTRHSHLLLARYGITTPLVSYHEHNEQRRAHELIKRLLAGKSVALISDAGMPVLSDPGYPLIRRAIDADVPVVSIPGPSAITAAVTVSGLPPDRFLFLGFLPRKAGERKRALQDVARLPWTLVMFEAPHRLVGTLEHLHAVLGNRRIALVRELTKQFEEVVRGTMAEVLARVRAAPPRGEVTLVVEGRSAAVGDDPTSLVPYLSSLLAGGMSPKDAARFATQAHGVPKRAAYRLILEILGKR